MHSKTPWRSGALRKVVFMLVPLVVLLLAAMILIDFEKILERLL